MNSIPIFLSPELNYLRTANGFSAKDKKPFFNQWFSESAINEYKDIDILSTHYKEIGYSSPNAFIFHTSRCGSSAAVNYFRALENCIVVPEAQPISVFCMKNNIKIDDWETKSRKGLETIFSLYKNFFCNQSQNLIIKFTSWNILDIKRIITDYPDVPALLIIRNPIEILQSCMRRHPGIVNMQTDPIMTTNIFGNSFHDLSTNQFLVRMIGSFFQAIRDIVDKKKKFLILDHENLNTDSMVEIQKFFNISVNDKMAKESLNFYSKNHGNENTIYSNSTPFQVEEIGNELIEYIEGNCMENYTFLKKQSIH